MTDRQKHRLYFEGACAATCVTNAFRDAASGEWLTAGVSACMALALMAYSSFVTFEDGHEAAEERLDKMP